MPEFECWQLGTCEFAQNPFGTMLMPFESIFGGLALVIFWALIIGVLWLRTQNPPLVGIIGILMVSTYLTNLGAVTPEPEFETARMVGGTLLALSIGISLYQIIVTRLHASPQ